jgi:Transglutaminase-like superfamily
MEENREISALLTLIDDPDEEVFTTVSERIIHYGSGIIPNLENLWENTPDNEIQERIEMIIHRVHFTGLVQDFTQWRDSAYHDLLFGALLVAKYQYPDLQTAPVIYEIDRMKRNIWLELNSYLTPLEQANVLNSILYNYYNLKGTEIAYTNADDFFIHKVVQGKKGNSISNGILYMILAELLDLPVRAVNIPRQFVLGYFNSEFDVENATLIEQAQSGIDFFVDASNGNPFTWQDVEGYLKRVSITPMPGYFKPLSKKRIIQQLLEELSQCFDTPGQQYKKVELLQLAALLDA